MLFLWIVLVVIVIVLNYYMANEFYSIAAEKGYDDKKYFWWTFLLFPIGAAMVIALPDEDGFNSLIRAMANSPDNQDRKKETIDELPEL